jgi:hypothetical protein
MSTPHRPQFYRDPIHAFQAVRIWQEWAAPANQRSRHEMTDALCASAQVLEIILYEYDWQLYYEGLILIDHHGDAFDRNLITEKAEQDRRS